MVPRNPMCRGVTVDCLSQFLDRGLTTAPAADIGALIEAGRTSKVVIAEAKDGGTNALLLKPPTALRLLQTAIFSAATSPI